MRSPFRRPHTLCRPLRRRNPPLSDAFLIVRRPFHLPDRLTKTSKVSKIHKGRDRNDLPNPLTRSNPVAAPPGGPEGSLPSLAKPVAGAPAHAPYIPREGLSGIQKRGSAAPETHPKGSLQASSERLVRNASRVPERPTTPASANTRDRARRLRPAPSTLRFRGVFWGRQAVRQNRTPFSNPFASASISMPIGNCLETRASSPAGIPGGRP